MYEVNYATLKYNHSLQTVKIKKENYDKKDMVAKINQYIDGTCRNFYTIKVDVKDLEMVELHTYQLYTYSSKDNEIFIEGTPFGGNRSVQLP